MGSWEYFWRRVNQVMETIQHTEKPESKPADKPVQGSTLKSKFDEVEYERWSQKIRNGHSKGK
jgi:hypothetical protein